MGKTSDKRRFNVTGMSCAACQAHVTKAVSSVEGVSSCDVSLLTNSMTVEGDASSDDIIKAVENAGYGASSAGSTSSSSDIESRKQALEDKETPILARRLVASVVFLLILMYFSMGVTMWNLPIPEFVENNMMSIGIIEMLLAGIVMVINQKFFISGFKSLAHMSPNMDTLVAMGSGVSFIYSFVVLITNGHVHNLYFESAAMIVTLITIGKLLESISKGRTTSALVGLMDLSPKSAVVIRDGNEVTAAVEEVEVGDTFVVRPGGSIPVDGVIIEGSCAVDESALTGESVPVDKNIGDKVSAATINMSGYVRCRATGVGEDTTLSQIIRMVSDASSGKAPIARIADKVSGVFVPAVIGIAVIVFVIWMILGEGVSVAVTRAISVLVVSCPCALGLATPVAIMVGNGVAARNDILFKTAQALEQTGRTEVVVLDKTGTITKGTPEVTDVIPVNGTTINELLEAAMTLESSSEHPLGIAIAKYCKDSGINGSKADSFEAVPGKGLRCVSGVDKLIGGNLPFIKECGIITGDEIDKTLKQLAGQGMTPMFFAKGDKLLGIIAAADTIRDDSAAAITELKNLSMNVVMLTGDNQMTADAIGAKAGVDKVIAGVLPGGKEEVIRTIQQNNKVVMVGDGINDAPALTRADTGIAIGAGTDIAIDAADVVLVKSSIRDVAAAVRISRRTLLNIKENLFWAFIYNILLIPVAAGLYAKLGITMTPMFGAAAMSLSSFTVCMNALRLNLIRPYDGTHDRPRARKTIDNIIVNNTEPKERRIMEKTITIEGMMCGHCEANVRKALEAIEGVTNAEVSHEKGTAVVTFEGDVSDDVMRKAVEDKEYKVISIS